MMKRTILLGTVVALVAGCGAMNDNPVSQKSFDEMYEKREREMRQFDPTKQVAPGIDQPAEPSPRAQGD